MLYIQYVESESSFQQSLSVSLLHFLAVKFCLFYRITSQTTSHSESLHVLTISDLVLVMVLSGWTMLSAKGINTSFRTVKTLVGVRITVSMLKMQAWCASVSVSLPVCLHLSVH